MCLRSFRQSCQNFWSFSRVGHDRQALSKQIALIEKDSPSILTTPAVAFNKRLMRPSILGMATGKRTQKRDPRVSVAKLLPTFWRIILPAAQSLFLRCKQKISGSKGAD